MQTMQQNMAAVIMSKINAQKIMQAGETTGRVDRLRCMWRRGEFQSIQRNCGMLADTYTRQTNPRQSRVTMETLLGSWQPYTYVWKTQRNHYIQVLMQGPQTFTMSQFQPCTVCHLVISETFTSHILSSLCALSDLYNVTFSNPCSHKPSLCSQRLSQTSQFPHAPCALRTQPVLSQTFTQFPPCALRTQPVLSQTFTYTQFPPCALRTQPVLTNLHVHTISTLCSQNPTCALTNLHVHTSSTLCSQNTTCTLTNLHIHTSSTLCSQTPSQTSQFPPLLTCPGHTEDDSTLNAVPPCSMRALAVPHDVGLYGRIKFSSMPHTPLPTPLVN